MSIIATITTMHRAAIVTAMAPGQQLLLRAVRTSRHLGIAKQMIGS